MNNKIDDKIYKLIRDGKNEEAVVLIEKSWKRKEKTKNEIIKLKCAIERKLEEMRQPEGIV